MPMKSESPKEASERLGRLRERMQAGVTEVTTGQIQPVRDVAVVDPNAQSEADKLAEAERDPVVIQPEGAEQAIADAGGDTSGDTGEASARRATRGRPRSEA